MGVLRRGAALIAIAAFAAAPPGAAAAPSAATPSGDAFVFHTTDALVAADTDTAFDAYVWRDGVNELVSTGTSSPAFARGISADGSHVVFESDDDLYVRSGGTTTHISDEADLGHISADGGRIVFTTTTPLAAADTDTLQDVYVRAGGATTLISTSPAGSGGQYSHSFVDSSLDGTRVYEGTDEPLTSNDGDTAWDIYDRSGGTARLVTTGTLGGGSALNSFFTAGGASEDGSSYLFTTNAQLELGDTNDDWDLYQRRNGRTRLLTANRLGLGQDCPIASGGFGPPPCVIFNAAQTPDGGTVFFGAGQRLATSDTNSVYDMYLRSGSSLEHVAEGGQGSMSPSAGRLVFHTGAGLVPGDTDGRTDLYERESGTFTLLTPGTPADNLGWAGTSRNADRVLFVTQEGVVPADTDNRRDVYESVDGSVRLVTSGPADDHANVSESEHTSVTQTEDGSRVFFSSRKALVAADTDTAADFYVWEDEVTRLVSG